MQVVEITKALSRLKGRGFGIIIDDASHFPRSVLFAPASAVTEKTLNEMLSVSASQVLVTIGAERRRTFQLGFMGRPGNLRDSMRSSFKLCESVEAREGIHTGISVHDRVRSLHVLASSEPNPRQIVKPGHVFPLEVAEGGVLVKSALFEAASDISLLSGNNEVAAVIDLLSDGGAYLSREEINALSEDMDLAVFHLSHLVLYRLRTEQLIERVAHAKLPVSSGNVFDIFSYRSRLNGVEHVALSLGSNFSEGPVLTRVHRERLLSDIFEPLQGNNSSILGKSMAAIETAGRGLIVYLRTNQQAAFNESLSAPARDSLFREYGVGAQIIKQCGVRQIELLSASAVIPEGLENFGLEISGIRQL